MEIKVLSCGCVADSIRTHEGGKKLEPPLPTCVHGTTEAISEIPDINGRTAKCADCGKITDSNWSLPFFRYQGPEAKFLPKRCGCGHGESDHRMSDFMRSSFGVCDSFQPRECEPYDKYYCGCYGWD